MALFTVRNYSVACAGIQGGKCPDGKVTMLYNMLGSGLSILKSHRLELPPAVSFRVVTGSTGTHAENAICIARSHPSKRCIMVPNPYFGDLRKWEAAQNEVVQQNRPWSRKKAQAFYRGDCASSAESRFSLISIDSYLLDVGWLNSATETCLKKFARNEEELRLHLQKRKKALPESQFTKYRYLLNMPGSSAGSYSRHLNNIWNKGSIVVMWQNSAVEWYYDALVENVTHITVNKQNILKMLEDLNSWPTAKLLELAGNAYKVYVERLSADSIALQWYKVLLHVNNQKRGDDEPHPLLTL